MQAVIDRFEGDKVILEFSDNTTKDVPRSLLPPGAKEGDILREVAGRYVVMEKETKARAKEIQDLMDDVWKD